ncbi:hypothetical protein IE53DRAFT_363962 [Violaceomyces palustris]|uniref:Uncharacterized protein n=1 Tax=Violaceomyces palustris TaxID=1673888 RepID=A0ACD0NRC8_9BASI|nr:hypothetical protein IE53DRAFT_363962 [Violaceomyces palustris]
MTWLDGFPSDQFFVKLPKDGEHSSKPYRFADLSSHVLEESILAWGFKTLGDKLYDVVFYYSDRIQPDLVVPRLCLVENVRADMWTGFTAQLLPWTGRKSFLSLFTDAVTVELRSLHDGHLISRTDLSDKYASLFAPQPVHPHFLPPGLAHRHLISFLAEDKRVKERYSFLILDADDLSMVASIHLPMPNSLAMTSYLFQPDRRLIAVSSGTGFSSAGNLELYSVDLEASPPAASLQSCIRLPASAPDFCEPLRISPLVSFSTDTYSLPDKVVAANNVHTFVVDVKAFDLASFHGASPAKARSVILGTSDYHELAAVLPYKGQVCSLDPRNARALVSHYTCGIGSAKVVVMVRLDASSDMVSRLPRRGRICFKERSSCIHEDQGVRRSPSARGEEDEDISECSFWHSEEDGGTIREDSPDGPIKYAHDEVQVRGEYQAMPLLMTKAQVPQSQSFGLDFAPGLWKRGIFRQVHKEGRKENFAAFWTFE